MLGWHRLIGNQCFKAIGLIFQMKNLRTRGEKWHVNLYSVWSSLHGSYTLQSILRSNHDSQNSFSWWTMLKCFSRASTSACDRSRHCQDTQCLSCSRQTLNPLQENDPRISSFTLISYESAQADTLGSCRDNLQKLPLNESMSEVSYR